MTVRELREFLELCDDDKPVYFLNGATGTEEELQDMTEDVDAVYLE